MFCLETISLKKVLGLNYPVDSFVRTCVITIIGDFKKKKKVGRGYYAQALFDGKMVESMMNQIMNICYYLFHCLFGWHDCATLCYHYYEIMPKVLGLIIYTLVLCILLSHYWRVLESG